MNTRYERMRSLGKCRWSINAWRTIPLFLLLAAVTGEGTAQKSTNAIPSLKRGDEGRFLAASGAGKSEPTQALPGVITGVTTTTQKGDLVISVAASTPVKHQTFCLDNPSRLVIDFLNTENQVPFFSLPVNTGKVKKIRISQFQDDVPKITRLVVDLDGELGPPSITSNDDFIRVVLPGAAGEVSAASQPTLAPPDLPARQRKEADKPSTVSGADGRLSNPGASTIPLKRTLTVSEISTSLPTALAKPEQNGVVPPNPSASTSAPTAKPTSPSPTPSHSPILIIGSAQESRFTGHPLTLDLVDIPLVDFFRLMAEEGGINIVMDPKIEGTISIKVMKVPWDQIFEVALVNHSLDKQIEGNLVRIARKTTLEEEAKRREALKRANMLAADLETRIKRLNYSKASSFIPTLQDQKTPRGTVVVDERTNSLILTDIPSSLDKMIELVTSLDIPQPQVEIEARIISATRDFARDIGIQFGFVQGNLERVTVGGPNTFGTIGGTRPTATPTTTFAAGNPRTGRGAAESSSSQSAGVSTGASSTNAGNLNVNLPAQKAFGGIGISVGNIFDTFLLDAAITAGESKGLAKLISQPRVTVQNNSPGTITQGLRFPVQIIANNTVSVQFQNAALTLTVTPQITYEGNIVLDLKVENNTPDFARQVNGIPSIRTSESTTRVLVSDGGTTVIGGILIDNETSQEERVPGLASLPLIGNIFRRSIVSRNTQEVLFFITPRIVK